MCSRILNSRKVVSVMLICLIFSLYFDNFAQGQSNYQEQVSGFSLVKQLNPETEVIATISIPIRNVPLLQYFAREVSDPTSSMYHKFLTQQQISSMFLPTQQFNDELQLLSETGLKTVFTAMDSIIVVQGTASQIRNSLGVSIGVYSNGTASYYYGAKRLANGVTVYSSNITAVFLRPQIVLNRQLSDLARESGNVTFTLGAYSMKLLRYAYNTSSLLENGVDGKGYTVGILDFYGSPTIYQDLSSFDKIFGVDPPPSFRIQPIGPYDPNLGVATGWDGEIALDVEATNAMAPGANIVLYAANGALPLVAPIAYIDSDTRGNVSVVSQSFGIYEWLFNQFDALTYVFNALLPDIYYMLGSVKGITFLASSGDAGGSGYSSGPEGNAIYPSSSPFVTAVGGTTTFVSNSTEGYMIKQTAWSNLPFVPFLVNFGGSGGGVSILEPKPWYQSSLQTPASFPNGRLVPDISLQASVYPGSYIVLAGKVLITGGTSEASPLLAGLLTILMQYKQQRFGLINPLLYSISSNSSMYSKAFTQITFGYTVPWTASKGYNLVTGLGSPNIGEIAKIPEFARQNKLSVEVVALNSTFGKQFEFTSNEVINIVANITSKGTPVSSGSFFASIETLSFTSSRVQLSYSPEFKLWFGSYTVNEESGPTYINVQGSSGSLSGSGFTLVYTGYFGSFLRPVGVVYSWSTTPGIGIIVNATDLNDVPASVPTIKYSVYKYSILSNEYFFAIGGNLLRNYGLYFGKITSGLESGPVTIVLSGGVYGYVPFIVGINLQTTRIYSQVVAEPGVVSPGQSLFIVANPIAPVNIASLPSLETGNTLGYDIQTGSNVTVSLVDQAGNVLASTHLANGACLEPLAACAGGATMLNGYLAVPENIKQGLYTILLSASFNSSTLGTTIRGSFFSQVYVANSTLRQQVSISPEVVYQGEKIKIVDRITYQNGTDVTNGLFTAFIYPRSLESVYAFVNHDYYVASSLVMLSYNPSLHVWQANVSLPSNYDQSSISAIKQRTSQVYGPYDVFVTGQSYDGYPLQVSSTLQKRFFIQPYLFVSGKTLTSLEQVSQVAFSDDIIQLSNTVLSGDLFIGTNKIEGSNIIISNSQINGTLIINGSIITLNSVTANKVIAISSKVKLVNSHVSEINLTNSVLSMSSSSYDIVNPSLPSISITSPPAGSNITGMVNIAASIAGSVSNVTLYLDGKQILTQKNEGSTISYELNTTSLVDGFHEVSVVAMQADGLYSTQSISFYTSNQHARLTSQLTSLSSELQKTRSELSNSQAQYFEIASALGLAGVAIGVASLARRKQT